MADQDLTSLDDQRPDGQLDQVLSLDDAEHETRRKLKAWADVEHGLDGGGHTIPVGPTPPVSPTNYQLWFNSSTGELLVYRTGFNQWVTVEQPTFNYLYNSGFTRFPNATSSPTGWSWYGTSTTGTMGPSGAGLPDTRQKFGPYACVISSGDGYKNGYQRVSNIGSAFAPPTYWSDRTVSFGCWVFASVGDKARIGIDALGVTGTRSLFHSGDSTWKWLTVTLKVPITTAITTLVAILCVEEPGITAVFSGPTFVEGSYCPHVLPSGIFLRSEVLHFGSTSGAIDTVPGGVIYYGPHGGNVAIYYVYAITPFRCLISNLRVYISNGAGAGKSVTATMTVWAADTPLSAIISDTNTFNFDNVNKVQADPGVLIALKVTSTAGALASALRASVLIEEVPEGLI